MLILHKISQTNLRENEEIMQVKIFSSASENIGY